MASTLIVLTTLLAQTLQGPATEGIVSIRRVWRAPTNFAGNVIGDPASGRLWLMSYGPPANLHGPSSLYELDPKSGRVLRATALPFHGEFGAAAYIRGSLYQVIPYESRLYEIAVDGLQAGHIVRTLALPTFADATVPGSEKYRFPFISFTVVGGVGDDALCLYASDLGELITIDAHTARILKRVRTSKGLAGVAAIPPAEGARLLLASFDPVDAALREEARRFAARGSHGILPLETTRASGEYGHPGQRTSTWLLIDAETGEVVAATALESARIKAGSVAIVSHERGMQTEYGVIVALTVGDDGLYTVAWTPQSSGVQADVGDPLPRLPEVVAAIVDALTPHIQTLTRPIYTFHYAMRTRMALGDRGYVPADTDRAWQYVTMKIARFWDLTLETHPNATVSGLYVATDPVIARSFGGVGDIWGMIQVVLDRGFRFVDVRRGIDAGQASEKLPASVRAKLSAAGCDAPYADALVTFLESKACRAIAVQVLQELQVDGILYSFQRYAFDACPKRPDGGFIVVNQSAVKPEHTQVFVPESGPDDASLDRLRIRDLFLRAKRAGSRRTPPWNDLASEPVPPSMDAWMREHLFGCGGYPEDRTMPITAAPAVPRRR